MTAPEAFGYCWHRSNGEWYYGIHKGTIDDGYVGSGVLFNKKFKGSDRSEWNRTIEFRGTFEECRDWEADMVTLDMINQPDCLNLVTGGRIQTKRTAEDQARISKLADEGRRKWVEENRELFVEMCRDSTKKLWDRRSDSERESAVSGLKEFHGSEAQKEHLKSLLTTEHQRKASKAAIASPNHISKRIATCPHCNLTGKGPNMPRYHFDNCKHKEKDK